MPTTRGPRISKVIVGIGVVFASWTLLGFWLDRPELHLASQAEVDAVLPKELLVEPPVDRAAQRRYDALVDVAKGLNSGEVFALISPQGHSPHVHRAKYPTYTAAQKIKVGAKFMKSYAALYSRAAELIEAGPLQRDRSWMAKATQHDFVMRSREYKSTLALTDLVRGAAQCSVDLAQAGKFRGSRKWILFALKAVDRINDANNDVQDYLNAVLLDGIAVGNLEEIIKSPGIPVDELRTILNAVHPASKQKLDLANAFRIEFQERMRHQLTGQPINSLMVAAELPSHVVDTTGNVVQEIVLEPLAGTYDATETAKMCGDRFKSLIANALRPLAQFDKSSDDFVEQQRKDLPTWDYTEKDAVAEHPNEWRDYCHRMNTGVNTIGRRMVSHTGPGLSSNLAHVSCLYRASRDAMRVLLASRIYRRAHQGALPSTVAGFLPILGDWPQNPYDGKPMTYLPHEQKLVAKNAGSNFTAKGKVEPTDYELSLKLELTARH